MLFNKMKMLRSPEGEDGGAGGGGNPPNPPQPPQNPPAPPEGTKPAVTFNTEADFQKRIKQEGRAQLREKAKEFGFVGADGKGDIEAFENSLKEYQAAAAKRREEEEAQKSELERIKAQYGELSKKYQAAQSALESQMQENELMKSAAKHGLKGDEYDTAKALYILHKQTEKEPKTVDEFISALKVSKPALFGNGKTSTEIDENGKPKPPPAGGNGGGGDDYRNLKPEDLAAVKKKLGLNF